MPRLVNIYYRTVDSIKSQRSLSDKFVIAEILFSFTQYDLLVLNADATTPSLLVTTTQSLNEKFKLTLFQEFYACNVFVATSFRQLKCRFCSIYNISNCIS